MGPGVSINEILQPKSCEHSIFFKELVASKAPCFHNSKMWSAFLYQDNSPRYWEICLKFKFDYDIYTLLYIHGLEPGGDKGETRVKQEWRNEGNQGNQGNLGNLWNQGNQGNLGNLGNLRNQENHGSKGE